MTGGSTVTLTVSGQPVGLLAGIAYNLYGSVHGSMGVDCGDFDNDGWLDIYQTSYQKESAALYRNLGGGQFEDVTLQSRSGAATIPHVTWATDWSISITTASSIC